MLTKGKMIKQLKEKAGIRFGDKNGAKVKLEHLKSFAITELYYQYCTK
jgi:hypothetical protein